SSSSHVSLFILYTPPPPEPYTLSLHAALPISGYHRAAAVVGHRGRSPHAIMRPRSAAAIPCYAPYRAGSSATARPCSGTVRRVRSEEHTSELQSRGHLVCRLLLEKKKINQKNK